MIAISRNIVPLLFALLRSAICGAMLTEEERNSYSFDQLADLLKISSKHDISHLLILGLKQNGLISKENTTIERSILKAVCRYEQINYAFGNLCDALEKAQIPFLPLKGSVLRQYYPEPWMRTSCDIDVLVHKEDAEKAKSILVNEHGYTYADTGSHDISLFTPLNVHVELHYDLIEDGRANQSANLLKNIWRDMVQPRAGYSFWYEMTDEMFYFYHIAHMAKHFETGGCGIRPLIDLWILDNLQEVSKEKRDTLLEQGGLLQFANSARKLSSVWFGSNTHDSISLQMENFILQGGVYGNIENRIIVQQQKKGGRFKYALSKIIIPYDVIKFHYPILQKHRWLTPFMQIRRWCKLIFCGHLSRATKELRYNSTISSTEAGNIQTFLDNIGL